MQIFSLAFGTLKYSFLTLGISGTATQLGADRELTSVNMTLIRYGTILQDFLSF